MTRPELLAPLKLRKSACPKTKPTQQQLRDMPLRLIDCVRMMHLDATSAIKYVAEKAGIRPGDLNTNIPITGAEMMELAKRYPKHTRSITIQCNDKGEFGVRVVGDWDGRMFDGAGRSFGHLQREFQKASMHGATVEGFKSGFDQEEVERADKERQVRIVVREIQQGLRCPDGSWVVGPVNEFAKEPGKDVVAMAVAVLNPVPISIKDGEKTIEVVREKSKIVEVEVEVEVDKETETKTMETE